MPELFNGKLRDELLKRESFITLDEAKVLIEQWGREYSRVPRRIVLWETGLQFRYYPDWNCDLTSGIATGGRLVTLTFS